MSDGQQAPGAAQAGGFDFRTLVSVASLIAAGAAIYYASTVDARDQVAALETSVKTLTARLDGLPDADGVKQIIGDTVTIPAPGPSAEDVQKMIETSACAIAKRIDALPDEAKVGEIADRRAAAADNALVDQRLSKLIGAGTIPKGAIVAFATACPAGSAWKEYDDARGRFLVATGKHTDTNGTTRSFEAGIGKDDGGYQHKLTPEEMPRHQHAIDRQGPTRGITDLPPIGTDGAIISTIEQELSHLSGGSKAHNNVPPYIALPFCEET
ncbi:MAG: hypothetical protein ACR2PM_09985 [Hyphomicrobiales bacterium]